MQRNFLSHRGNPTHCAVKGKGAFGRKDSNKGDFETEVCAAEGGFLPFNLRRSVSQSPPILSRSDGGHDRIGRLSCNRCALGWLYRQRNSRAPWEDPGIWDSQKESTPKLLPPLPKPSVREELQTGLPILPLAEPTRMRERDRETVGGYRNDIERKWEFRDKGRKTSMGF